MHKTNMQSLLRAVLPFACALSSMGAVFTIEGDGITGTYTPAGSSGVIGDNDGVGLTLLLDYSNPSVNTTSGLEVNLQIAGNGGPALAGDYYAYISGPNGGFSVLLNRIERTATTGLPSFGSLNNGLDVTLSDSASTDVHSYKLVLNPPNAQPVTGIYQPDARNVDPNDSITSSPRSAFLSSFDGFNPNGTWTLHIEDVSSGGTGKLVSVSVTPVPEPHEYALASGLGLIGFAVWRRRSKVVTA